MVDERFKRIRALLGEEAMEEIAKKRVAVFGVGGVGSFVVEGLVRSGIREIDIIDSDKVVLSNLNRQIMASEKTIGKAKVDALEERIHDIDPNILVHKYVSFYLPEKKDEFPFEDYDYIVDAIDTVTAKISLITEAEERNIPVISSMGCGNRLDPSKLCMTDIYKTKGDPLSKVMRRELRKRGVKRLKVVYSTEEPVKLREEIVEEGRRSTPGSSIFVPASAGLLIASVVIRELAEGNKTVR